MGNCLRHEVGTTQWAGEEWDFLATDDDDGRKWFLGDGEKKKCSTEVSVSMTVTEVKIKITKRQLEELLGKVDVKEISVRQVLAQLIHGLGDDQFHESRHRHWRPVLQSIPEVD